MADSTPDPILHRPGAALLTLDLVNDLVHPEGAAPGSASMVAERGVLDAANRAIAWARREGLLIVHVRVVFTGDALDAPATSPVFGPLRARQAVRADTWGSAFHALLDVRGEDTVLRKRRISPFYRTGLTRLLRQHRIGRLLVCGISTPFAVEAAVRDAHDRDLTVAVVTDACAAATIAAHEAALSGPMSRLATLTSSRQLDEALPTWRSGHP